EELKKRPAPTTPAAKPATPVVKSNGEAEAEAKRRKEEAVQDEKKSRKIWIWRASSKDDKRSVVQVEAPESPYTISAGWRIPVTIESRVNSDLPGTLVARVTQPIYSSADGQYLLIPEGSTFVGQQQGSPIFGESRLNAVFSTLSFPNAAQIVFKSPIGGGSA